MSFWDKIAAKPAFLFVESWAFLPASVKRKVGLPSSKWWLSVHFASLSLNSWNNFLWISNHLNANFDVTRSLNGLTIPAYEYIKHSFHAAWHMNKFNSFVFLFVCLGGRQGGAD